MTRFGFIGIALLALTSAALAEPIHGIATKVHDGDTLTLSTGQHIRLFGIDAPELNQQCERRGVCVPCGEEAGNVLKDLAVGELTCEPRGESYDRIVARCSIGTVDLSLAMIQLGEAVAYPQYLHKRDPLRPIYLDAETKAIALKVGIWAGRFVNPGKWRNHKVRLACER